MEFFYVVKATQKSGKDDAVIWFTAKSEARANLQLDVELEDAGIETGRGKDYAKPFRTDFPVYNDLPEESTVDYTWCKRYELDEDQRTWKVKLQHEDSYQNSSEQSTCSITVTDTKMPELLTVATLPLRQRILAQFISDEYAYHIDTEQKREIQQLEMDVDNSYVQNMLLAAENVDAFKKATEFEIARVVEALKTVFPLDGKRTELSLVIHFFKTWFNTEHIDRGILVREWANGNRISNVQRTDSGTNADGGHVTDRGEGAHHTLDTLDLEIACALLPMDFHHFEIPSSVLRRAKEIVWKKEEPWKSWSAILRNQPGVLEVNRAAIFNLIRIAPENIHHTPAAHLEFVNKTMTAEFNSALELLPLPTPAVETEAPGEQPQVENLGSGVFSIDGLMGGNTEPVVNTSSNEVEKTENAAETTSDVQMETAKPEKDEDVGSVPPSESTDAANTQTDSLAPEDQQSEPVIEYPAYFEPGRYEGLPNHVYHAANGISSTQVKDARVSLMYFNARHVAKTIPRTASKVLDMGNLVHALALQPENLEAEFSVEPEIPEGAFTTTATLREFIDAYNASLPALLSADEIKALLEEHNASLPAQVPLGGSLEETAQSYMVLPAEFQRIEEGQKQTATAMKACIKEYNATLPPQVKTNGSRDALLEQLAIINPDLVAQEAQKPTPLKVSGTKADMIQAVKSVKPDAMFADELLDAWRDNPGEKILVTRQQLATARAIQSALLAHPTAGMLLTHPSRAVEVSYFGFDDETGLEVRVRPDLEIELDGVRIGADLKTISMWNVKQESLRARLHREIIDRDYHLSAAMYCETAALDQFFWIFVNKDENYHWIAIIEASTELLELGMLEYRKTMRAIATGFDTGEWPAPITTDYTDELNDFDLRRLEALRAQA
ncbi:MULTISPECIES: RecE family exodeoxyribonuclease [unclassified Enterobacter cloacae complex]|uniref:RecE family exodeoxyribonuclease n=1 Tax=unclassified Enterobacter cloacae complex TaxID=2757714 RepID=UPI001875DAA2|nr:MULTISPECIES: RecE family exodeoxyribonuclease [unclassified Enterobacter cloacae complex]MBE4945178.1 PD-(D/E)XK nuclease-like domain-containing protein [Enterobacter cloacae complex sp. P1B]MBE4971516.1 PD-(D/E)XK nuclease-like domain-containing protein [Enterobacter cloacae complex sp. P11RS]